MSFTWTAQPGKLIKAQHINEVRTNIDAMLSSLGLPAYSWSKVPVSPDDLVDFEVLGDVRSATDYSDDENYCQTHNVTENSPHRTSHFGTDNNNVETGNNATNHSNYNNNVDTGHQTNNNSTVRSLPHHSIHRTTHYGTYYNNHDATNRNSPHNSSFQGTFNASVK